MRRLFILLPLLLVASVSALAEDRLDVNWREARVVKLSKAATSIIIGDPTVADVTLDDPTTLVVFGKAPGETNIVVLSGSDGLLFDWPLVVSPLTAHHVTVLNATSDIAPTEVLYSCGNERCTRVLSPSDISFRASSSSSTNASSDATKSASSSTEPNGNPVPVAPGQAGTTGTTDTNTAPAQ